MKLNAQKCIEPVILLHIGSYLHISSMASPPKAEPQPVDFLCTQRVQYTQRPGSCKDQLRPVMQKERETEYRI